MGLFDSLAKLNKAIQVIENGGLDKALDDVVSKVDKTLSSAEAGLRQVEAKSDQVSKVTQTLTDVIAKK